jgi:hypothetical protein
MLSGISRVASSISAAWQAERSWRPRSTHSIVVRALSKRRREVVPGDGARRTERLDDVVGLVRLRNRRLGDRHAFGEAFGVDGQQHAVHGSQQAGRVLVPECLRQLAARSGALRVGIGRAAVEDGDAGERGGRPITHRCTRSSPGASPSSASPISQAWRYRSSAVR